MKKNNPGKKSTRQWWHRLGLSELGLRLIVVSVIVVGSIAYLVLTTGVATRGLQVKALSDRLEELQKKQNSLQIEADRLQSMTYLDQVSAQYELVRVSRVDYLTPTGPVAAR